MQSLAGTVVIALFVITFVVQAFQIPSVSMEDTLLVGDYLLVDKLHYGPSGPWSWILPYRKVKRGDIIVFRYPLQPEQHFVKRVVAVPGDRVRLEGAHLLVNGRVVQEEYALYRSGAHPRPAFPSDQLFQNVDAHWWLRMRSLVRDGELVIPEGKYFALGDNRDESLDSRYWGFVPRENIIGRPLLIYWSMRAPEPDVAGDGRVARFAYLLSHLFEYARWDRTFRVVK